MNFPVAVASFALLIGANVLPALLASASNMAAMGMPGDSVVNTGLAVEVLPAAADMMWWCLTISGMIGLIASVVPWEALFAGIEAGNGETVDIDKEQNANIQRLEKEIAALDAELDASRQRLAQFSQGDIT